ncbi:hypothetical protein [Bradyrhizobium elkanii]|uniref:hypothetical protein n=1 Tax=Bradyrhizobium elkanii TaxID=29448 RepID=UPI002714CC81|nr:hypothetical protein [Bradyrhizobium elkanii]WLC11845.1 hypothetical protein QIH86_21520 [Bradyrhizobium elkanii USDA 94]
MSFYLVRLEPDGAGAMKDVPIPDYGPYDKGSEAAKAAKTLTEERGYKVQPRRMAQAKAGPVRRVRFYNPRDRPR